ILDQDFQIGRHETENGRAKLPHYVAQPRPCPPKILGSFSFFFRYGFRRSLGLHLPDLRRLQQNPFRRSVLILNDYAKPMSLTANISALSLHLPNDIKEIFEGVFVLIDLPSPFRDQIRRYLAR